MGLNEATSVAAAPEAAASPTTTAAQSSPRRKIKAVLNKNPNGGNDGELFSPTSAAALALSTLHHFGADQRPSAASMKGTRLFNAGQTQEGDNKKEGAAAPEAPAAKESKTTKSKKTETQAATNAPVNNNNALSGALAYSYPNGVPPNGPPPHYPPPPPHHAHNPFPSYGHDPRFAAWPPSSRPGDSSMAPSTAASWPGPPYQYPPRPGTSYPLDGLAAAGSHGSTPAIVGPSPPSSRSGSAGPEGPYYYASGPPRSSPVGFTGPSPRPAGADTTNPPPPLHDKPYLRAQSETTLVTPTPKKAKLSHRGSTGSTSNSNNSANNSAYSRKKKSLGVLAENFLKEFENLPQGSTVIVDEAAVKLGVERRRIYDVVNILESISLVCKKHKNTYTWMGKDHLDVVFGRLQAAAMEEYPEDAKKFLGATESNPLLKQVPVGRNKAVVYKDGKEFKSLAKLSQEFLYVFLVGHEIISLPEASDKIQGTTSMEELAAMAAPGDAPLDEKELKAAAARGLKTKIRRLYDIANVFLSLGLMKKVETADAARRPNFSWTYRLSAKQLYDLYRPSKLAAATLAATRDVPTTESHVSKNSVATVSDSSASVSPCSSSSDLDPAPTTNIAV